MKKTLLFAAATAALHGGVLAQTPAPSAVSIYGIVDLALRHTTNDGATAATRGDSQSQVTAGMSQSRLGLNISEDLGGGLRALGNLEHRFNADEGTQAATDFWRQSWVGLQGGFGRITVGRQYNVLFDVFTSTYASFRYSPYIETFKPEIGFSLGARNSNMVKYLVESGPWRAAVQASVSEGAATGGKSSGGYVRYASGGFAAGGAYLALRDGAARKSEVVTLGGSYSSGPWSTSLGLARNKFESGFNPLIIASLLGNGGTNGTFALGNVEHRDMLSVGAGYQLTPQLNLGAHYWHVRQTGRNIAGDGKADFYAVVADYAFSKRTDVYLEIDRTRFRDSLAFTNGATSRVGTMVGVRHRF